MFTQKPNTNVYTERSSIHNCLERTQMFFYRKIDNLWYTFTMEYYISNKKEETIDKGNNMKEFQMLSERSQAPMVT